MWDYDTLAFERARFPNALELITGKFPRHSRAFYEWRSADREARLESEPENLALYDDLAVAYDKLGRHEEAVALMRRKDLLNPGLYETQANLGTFLIHGGKMTEGLVHIDKAIAINPDAHFGREVYQKLLVQYVISRSKDGAIALPLSDMTDRTRSSSFADYVLENMSEKRDMSAEISDAVTGVLGMMRFGTHDSPILLEALGDLLSHWRPEDGKRLAARAYLQAASKSDGDAAGLYRQYATRALSMQTVEPRVTMPLKLTVLEQTFAAELQDAASWYEKLEADEAKWIAEGGDVDAKFMAKYLTPKVPLAVASPDPFLWHKVGLALVALVCVALLAAYLRWKSRRAATDVA